jgi:enoyl-CoA hydratase/carnithine racemase
MIFTAEPIDAQTGASFGLVDEVVPKGSARAAAVQLAASIGSGPAMGLAAVKDLIDRSHNENWSTLRERSFVWSDAAFSSEDCAAGVRAFRAKERPTFTGSAVSPNTVSAGAAK